jgi:hypothetical protein
MQHVVLGYAVVVLPTDDDPEGELHRKPAPQCIDISL